MTRIEVMFIHRVFQPELQTLADAVQAESDALRASCSTEKEEIEVLQAQVRPCCGLCLLNHYA